MSGRFRGADERCDATGGALGRYGVAMPPSPEHEHLVELFRNRPVLAVELLRASGGPPLPPFGEASLASVDQTEVPPATRLADVVVQLRSGDETVAAIVVEVQLGRKERKRYTWPLYVASVRAELRCSTMLLVLAPRRSVARWAARPIAMGHPDWVFRPVVVGPEGVPVVTDPTVAEASPELAVLSALAHGAGEHGYEVARAMLYGLGRVDDERAWIHGSIVLPALGEAVRARLEEEISLSAWLVRAVRVERAEDLFDDDNAG